MKNKKNIYFYFANLGCRIAGPKENINYILKSYKKSPFKRFVSENPPKSENLRANLSVRTIASKHSPSGKELFQVESDPTKLNFKMTCSKNTFFIFPVIEQVLRKIFYVLFFKDYGFILHASAAISRGKAYIFTGLPGAGKSTVAKTLASSDKFEIISDNNVFIKKEKRKFVIYKSPFLEWNVHQKKLLSPRKNFDIKSVFILLKAKKTFKEKISFQDGINSTAKQIQIPLSSLSKNEIELSRKLIFEFIADKSDNLYKLHFRKNDQKLINFISS